MKHILYTPAVAHLMQEKELYSLCQYPDGEWQVQLPSCYYEQSVIVVSSTYKAEQSLMSLLLFLDSLKKSANNITLIMTYFSYARQHSVQQGQSSGADVKASILLQYTPSIITLHAHNNYLQEQYAIKNVVWYEYFYQCCKDADVIVAPDQGVYPLATHIAQLMRKHCIMINKVRKGALVEHTLNNENISLPNKKVIIVDDMISTGATVLSAAALLKEQGVASITVAVTHGLFCDATFFAKAADLVSKLYVTDTIVQEPHELKEVVSIKPWLSALINNQQE